MSNPRPKDPTPDGPDLDLETDSRFPSGPWVGYFLQKELPPGKHGMELRLTFRRGVVTGEGRDLIGEGIWGVWEIPPSWKGGFYIWPEAMGDPTKRRLHESIEEPFNDFIEADAPAVELVAAADAEPQAEEPLA